MTEDVSYVGRVLIKGDGGKLIPCTLCKVGWKDKCGRMHYSYAVKNENGGSGTIIKGQYDSLEALEKAHPTGTDSEGYLVGGELYGYNTLTKKWEPRGSLQGPRGEDGKSAYDIAVEHGFEGTEDDWYSKTTPEALSGDEIDQILNQY